MRTGLLWLSGILALFFAISFALTFFARDYIARLAQGYVIDKTQQYADPIVEAADQAARAPGIKLILNEEQIQAARHEIIEYRDDPRAFIANLVASNGRPLAVDPGKDAPLNAKVLFWKGQVRAYFDKTLNRLLFDLRIFFASNLVAALLAFACAGRAKFDRLRPLLFVCGLLLASMAYSVYMYIDSFSYFRILRNTYMGWWYPALLALMFLEVYLGYLSHREPTPTSTGAEGQVRSKD